MPKDRSGQILEEIEKRKAVPIPRWHFFVKQFGFWLLAVISVITGSISMATAIYVFIDNDFIEDQDYIRLFFTARPFLADLITAIPYLWLLALLLFILVAYFGFRHTRKGYRYATTKVIAASLLVSLLLSVCLNMVDVGGYIHRYLIENVHAYNKLIYSNEHRWSHSEKGLLGGKVMQYDKSKRILVVRDFSKVLWSVDISTAEVRAGTIIAPGKSLKITGIKTGNRTFQAVLVQGWEKRYRKRVLPVQKPAQRKTVPDSLAH